MADYLISRRGLLAGTAAVGALSLTGLPARAEVQWKKHAGTKLEVILAKGPRGDNLQKNIKEFTELTGIQVEFGTDPRTAAASEGGDRTRFGQTELRHRST